MSANYLDHLHRASQRIANAQATPSPAGLHATMQSPSVSVRMGSNPQYTPALSVVSGGSSPSPFIRNTPALPPFSSNPNGTPSMRDTPKLHQSQAMGREGHSASPLEEAIRRAVSSQMGAFEHSMMTRMDAQLQRHLDAITKVVVAYVSPSASLPNVPSIGTSTAIPATSIPTDRSSKPLFNGKSDKNVVNASDARFGMGRVEELTISTVDETTSQTWVFRDLSMLLTGTDHLRKAYDIPSDVDCYDAALRVAALYSGSALDFLTSYDILSSMRKLLLAPATPVSNPVLATTEVSSISAVVSEVASNHAVAMHPSGNELSTSVPAADVNSREEQTVPPPAKRRRTDDSSSASTAAPMAASSLAGPYAGPLIGIAMEDFVTIAADAVRASREAQQAVPLPPRNDAFHDGVLFADNALARVTIPPNGRVMDYKFFYKNLQAGKAYKYWEKQWDTAIVADNSFIMRLDGRAFSKYQNNFRRPHDEAFFRAMALTACDLLLEFKCNSCYCESDEISMIWFHPKKPQYQGRMQKLCSVIAGFASARFNDHVKRQVFRVICENNEELRRKLGICLDDLVVSDKTVIFGDDLITSNGVYEPDKLRHIIAGRAHFDARVFCMPEPDHVLKYVLSRMDDGLRNAVNAFARMRFSQEEMTNKSCKQVLRMLRRENMDLSKEPDWFKYGVLVKVARVGATSIFREYIPAGKRPSSSAMVNPLGRGSVPACFAVMMKNCDHWLQVLQAEVVETVEERFVVPWSQTSTLPVDQIDNDEENTEALAIENAIAEDGSRTPKSRYRLYDSDYEEDDPRTAALSSDEDEADEPVNQPPLETVLDPRMVEYARKTHEEGDTIALGLGSQE